MNIMKERLYAGPEAEDGLDLESKAVWTVNNNPGAFDGITIVEVRGYFKA